MVRSAENAQPGASFVMGKSEWRRHTRSTIVCAVVALGSLAASCRGWREADRFTRKLRCGMSVEDVRARARSLHASQFYADTRGSVLNGTHAVAEGSSRVYLSFDAGGLRWFRNASQAGLTGMRVGIKHDLCSGRSFVTLMIDGGPEWSNGTVTVNGATFGKL